MAFMSSLSNNTSRTNRTVNAAQAVNTARKVSTASTQVNAAYSTNIDNLSDAVICSLFAIQPNKEGPNYALYGFLIFKFQLRDEFVNKHVVENFKAKSSEEEPKPKIEKKTVRPSIAKIEFVKSKQQEKTARKTVKKFSNIGKTLTVLEIDCNYHQKQFQNQRMVKPVWNNAHRGNPQMNLQDQGAIDSGCSRHMIWNMSYLTDYEKIDGGYAIHVPQTSGPTNNIIDEAVHNELGDSLVMAATTASSLEVEKGNGNTLQSDEDILKLNELMEICTNLQNKVLDLEKTITTQKSFGDKESLGEDASKQERKINAIDANDEITLVNDADNEMFDLDDLGGEDVFVVKHKKLVGRKKRKESRRRADTREYKEGKVRALNEIKASIGCKVVCESVGDDLCGDGDLPAWSIVTETIPSDNDIINIYKQSDNKAGGQIWLCHSTVFGWSNLRIHEDRPVIRFIKLSMLSLSEHLKADNTIRVNQWLTD
nr:hypothetical protein [Tanacetum cinerariifolium]